MRDPQSRRVRVLSRLGTPSNDEILAAAYSRGRVRLKIEFAVQVTRASTHVDHPKAVESTFLKLKDPCRILIDVATPEGVVALLRVIRESIDKLKDVVGRMPGEDPNGSTLPPC